VTRESRPGDEIVVTVDPELQSLMPGFLAKRRAEVDMLRAALAAADMAALRGVGHNLKGMGGGFGLDALTELGRQLEHRARAGDLDGTGAAVEAIADYVMRVEVVYGE